jgi:hypothetical protein
MKSCLKLIAIVVIVSGAGCLAAESVSINLAGKTGHFTVVKMGKTGIVLKADGKEQTVPMQVLTTAEVLDCYGQIEAKDKTPQLRFDVGSYLFKNKCYKEAEEELKAAMNDEKLRPAAGTMLVQIAEKTAKTPVAPDKTPKPEESKVAEKTEAKEKKIETKIEKTESGTTIIVQGDDMEAMKSAAMEQWRKERKNVPERSKAEMDEFLKKREEDLNKIVAGSKWRMIETKHFYCFSNVPEPKHKGLICNQWLEMPRQADGKIGIYPLLCEVLMHKEGDKLWHNKCPIYFFEKYSEFQTFAAQIDKVPGAGYSGGYFMPRGREVHICIPFMTQRLGEKAADRQAKSTLYHEGTHAFLQLSGEDVDLSRWLHEGLAQFIEFWFDRENNPERKQRAAFLDQQIRKGEVPSWSSMKERPAGGGDLEGYAWAWIKFDFLYRNFPTDRVPKMIREIKAGTAEDDAVKKIYGISTEKLEEVFKTKWLADRKTWDPPVK